MYMCVHKIMNMYIHGMYMVQTCMYRFAHSCGGVRIPDEERNPPLASWYPCNFQVIHVITCFYMLM